MQQQKQRRRRKEEIHCLFYGDEKWRQTQINVQHFLSFGRFEIWFEYVCKNRKIRIYCDGTTKKRHFVLAGVCLLFVLSRMIRLFRQVKLTIRP